MEFTSAQIDRIKELATMLTPVSDIAVLMDVDERRLREIISDKSHPASIAYRKGKAERALQIRQNELELQKPEARWRCSLWVPTSVTWIPTKIYNYAITRND